MDNLSPGVQRALPHTTAFEDVIPWMYLDTKGIVTVGVGCALLSVEEAQALPFLTPTGVRASAEQIAADYARVASLPPGLLAKKYRNATSLIISGDVVNTLLGDRLEKSAESLRGLFPLFDRFPVSGQSGLVDMVFNLGIGRAGPPATGFHEYHTHLIPALLKTPPDWATAAANCARNVHMAAFNDRNEWTKQEFLLAAKG